METKRKLAAGELGFWLAMNRIAAIGPIRWSLLLRHFPTLAEAWTAPISELLRAGLEQKICEQLIAARPTYEPMAELDLLSRLGLQTITILDDRYPPLLREIYAPPPVLYVRGTIDWLTATPIAIVGTRKMSRYGQRVTEDIASSLAQRGCLIVSGLALGIDAAAHQAAVRAGGQSAAVLGSGLDMVYPRANARLAAELVEHGGGLLSEFPPGTRPFRSNFPRRNRIIAGVSRATIVTEADFNSGALITARYALEQNRDVLTVPGSIYNDGSRGPNSLIGQGAIPIGSVAAALAILGYDGKISHAAGSRPAVSQNEELLLAQLGSAPVHVDKLARLARLNISAVSAALLTLEVKGYVKHLGNQQYIRC